MRNNSISLSAATSGFGILGNGPTDTFCIGNTVHKLATPISSCQLGTDNLTN